MDAQHAGMTDLVQPGAERGADRSQPGTASSRAIHAIPSHSCLDFSRTMAGRPARAVPLMVNAKSPRLKKPSHRATHTEWDRLSPVPCTLNTNNTHQTSAAFCRTKARANMPPKSRRSAHRPRPLSSAAPRQQQADRQQLKYRDPATSCGGTIQRQQVDRRGP